MAMNSRSVTWYHASVGVSFLLKNATGRYSCDSLAPNPTTDASQQSSKGLSKSGNFNTGADVNLALRVSNAHCYSKPHTNGPLINIKSLIGAAIVVKCDKK